MGISGQADDPVDQRLEEDQITNETRLTRLQAIVVEILSDLLRATTDETDQAINRAIARLGTYCLRDRAYVFVNGEGSTSNTHEWCADDIEPAIDQLQELPWELYGPIYGTLNAGETFHVPDVAALDPDSPTRAILESQEIRSILMVPMQWEGRFFGILGFDGVENTHAFLPGEIYLLRSVADVICANLTRRNSELARREAQEALQSERAFLQSILTTSAMGLIVLNGEGQVTFANEAACALLEVPGKRLFGMSHTELQKQMTPDDAQPEADSPPTTPFTSVLRDGVAVSGVRISLPGRSGPRYCAIHAAEVGFGHSEARVVYAMVDVTEQERAEAARSAALEEARRANSAKTRFLARMSHEMRTPLNGVLGIADVLNRLIQDPDQKRMIEVMHASGSLLLNIINDLLDMSKIEAEQLTIEQIPFDLAEVAERIEAVHTLKAAEKKLSFGMTVSPNGLMHRQGDPHRLLQIMHNVISNAIKFTQEGAINITIDCSLPDEISVEVTDTGIGMSPEQQRHVFEEFGQADSDIARKFGGTGLGMPIAQQLARLMGGGIEVRSRPGEGTSVRIDLPLPACDACAEKADSMTAPDSDESFHGLRILAADDNRTNRMILGAMMGQLGITAVLCADGPSALKTFDTESFDAVILDISMPEMDGLAVLKTMRQRETMPPPDGVRRPPHLPILAFTANAMAHQIANYLQAGFDDCLTKPLHLERLRAALAAHVTSGRQSRRALPIDPGASGPTGAGHDLPAARPVRKAGRQKVVPSSDI